MFICHCKISFPLTLALSLGGERGKSIPIYFLSP